ncbi:hypothetical protein [Streptomyces xantholiticus]|nr:hypothetical protein [Streptomyces xantholiticus]
MNDDPKTLRCWTLRARLGGRQRQMGTRRSVLPGTVLNMLARIR